MAILGSLKMSLSGMFFFFLVYAISSKCSIAPAVGQILEPVSLKPKEKNIWKVFICRKKGKWNKWSFEILIIHLCKTIFLKFRVINLKNRSIHWLYWCRLWDSIKLFQTTVACEIMATIILSEISILASIAYFLELSLLIVSYWLILLMVELVIAISDCLKLSLAFRRSNLCVWSLND